MYTNGFPDRYNGVNPMAIVNGVASAPPNGSADLSMRFTLWKIAQKCQLAAYYVLMLEPQASVTITTAPISKDH